MNATSIPSWVKDARTAYAFGVYGYDPSIPAAWTATALYAVMTIVTLAQTLRWSPRAWYMYWIPATAAMELVGYVVRVINLDDRTLGTVIVTILFLLIPPIFLAIVLYRVLGYIMSKGDLAFGCIKPHLVARFFFLGDIICFIIQAFSAPLMTSKDAKLQAIGQKVILVGLVAQFIVFLVFFVAVVWAWRHPTFQRGGTTTAAAASLPTHATAAEGAPATMIANPSIPAAALSAVPADPAAAASGTLIPHQRRIFATLVTTVFLLLVRNVYRLYEYGTSVDAKNHDRFKQAEEWEFYIFDFLAIYVCYILLAWTHFGHLIPHDPLPAPAKKQDNASGANAAAPAGTGASAPSTSAEVELAPSASGTSSIAATTTVVVVTPAAQSTA